MSTPNPDLSLSRALVRLVRSLPVEAGDQTDAERFVRDLLGSAAAGLGSEPGRMLQAYGRSATDLETVVFTAAALSHIAETDDLHRASVTHPGCVIVPVALILGHDLHATGAQVLHAVLAGYEVMLRIGEALGPGHYRIFHNTATVGVFGSAAAAATLLGLDEDAWVWALGNAGTQASGLWEFNQDAAMSKHLHAGHAAQSGLRAALLAREGFTGAETILEGQRGFFAGFCPDPRPQRVLSSAPGWKAKETSLKPYPSCRHTHPAVDAALQLRRGLGPDPADALAGASLTVGSYPAALGLTDNPEADTPYGAKFSVQFCVATALVHGPPTLESFDPDRLFDPAVRSVMERTRVEVDDGLARAYPHSWGARVTIDVDGSDRFEAVATAPKGDPEHPLSDEEIDHKVRTLSRFGGLSSSATEDLIHASKALRVGGPAFLPPGVAANRREGAARVRG